MCKNLIEKGQFSQPLIVFNRTLERASDFQKSHPDHVAVAPSIEDAVSKSNIIFTCLGDHAAVQATVDTICKTDIQNKLFVDCSTVHPDTTNETGSTLSSHGASFVACPVFGAPAMADAGQLICVLAGTSESIDKVLPYCKGVMGRANIEYRDQPCGQATLLKVIGNTLILNMVEALAGKSDSKGTYPMTPSTTHRKPRSKTYPIPPAPHRASSTNLPSPPRKPHPRPQIQPRHPLLPRIHLNHVPRPLHRLLHPSHKRLLPRTRITPLRRRPRKKRRKACVGSGQGKWGKDEGRRGCGWAFRGCAEVDG